MKDILAKKQNMNGHEEMVPLGPPLQREEGQVPGATQPAEAQTEEGVALWMLQAQLQDLLFPQADALIAPSASPTPRRPVRSTSSMEMMTYEIKGESTSYA